MSFPAAAQPILFAVALGRRSTAAIRGRILCPSMSRLRDSVICVHETTTVR